MSIITILFMIACFFMILTIINILTRPKEHYNTFIPAEPAICPFCKKRGLVELSRVMINQFDVNSGQKDWILKDGYHKFYSNCEVCKGLVYAEAIIKNENFRGIRNIKDNKNAYRPLEEMS